MTTPHFVMAEDLLKRAAESTNPCACHLPQLIAQAQAHATLALVQQIAAGMERR